MLRASLALVLLVAFASVCFGWRTTQHARRYGDPGLRLDRRGPERVIGPLLVVAFGAIAAAPVVALVGGSPRFPGGPEALNGGGVWSAAASVVGVLVAVGAGALTAVAEAQMGASWRIGVEQGERTELVTVGLFAHIRNPIFTGMLTFAVGVTLLVPDVIALVGAGLAVVTIQSHVRLVEEPNLRTVHGARYLAWASQTGRFVPSAGTPRPEARV